MKDTSKISSEQVLMWAQMTEAQRAKKAVLYNIEVTDFDLIRRDRHNSGQNRQQMRV